jgi:pSer/pThr/pTyr-binding forkhead associated (FHA) protein
LNAVDSSPPPTQVARYWVEYRGHPHELPLGETLIGRSSGCGVTLDDPLVSRRHARLVVRHDGAVVEDLGSVNGVYVNGVRIRGSRVVSEGDRIAIGGAQLVMRRTTPQRADRRMAETLHGDRSPLAVTQAMKRVDPGPLAESEATVRGDVFDLLGGVARKVLALGRGEEAERLLAASLEGMLSKAKEKGGGQLGKIDVAAEFAVKLAVATKKARWIDYTFELFTLARRPLPTAVVDELYQTLRRVSGVSVNGLREYVSVLEQLQLGPAERFLVQRIEGLEHLVR